MREILFRGKREDNGQWVIGFLSKTRGLDNKLHICIDYEEKGLMCSSIVVPSTIGQYTGLTDKNGTKIFEGDIVKEKDCVHNGEIQIYGRKWAIYFKDGVFFGYRKGYKGCGSSNFLPNIRGIEIIGNIHTTPNC